MQFPVSLADDGLIDIAIQESVSTIWFVRFKQLTVCLKMSRRGLLRAMEGADEGRTYWVNSVNSSCSRSSTPLTRDGRTDTSKHPLTVQNHSPRRARSWSTASRFPSRNSRWTCFSDLALFYLRMHTMSPRSLYLTPKGKSGVWVYNRFNDIPLLYYHRL
jgi:hypothetical protein